MTKTAKQIVGDAIKLLKGSKLARSITGGIYRTGCRPKGSIVEDLIVIYTTGTPSQIQRGIITLNIYVADIQYGDIYMENGRRCEEIEIMANEWVEAVIESSVDYLFELQQTIYTECESDINQHFIVIKLKYKLITN